MKINGNYLKVSYEHFESALELLKNLKLRNFVSRFYYGVIWFLSGICEVRGGWHDENRYKKIFKKYQILKDLWKDSKTLRIAADYKKWEDYEHILWDKFSDDIENFFEFLEGWRGSDVVVDLIRGKIEEIQIWLRLLKGAKQ
jgi:hypothetical protein